MFTGIVKAAGTVERISPQENGLRLEIRCEKMRWQDYSVGESIAVNGVCLTAADVTDDGFNADVSAETLRVTALAGLEAGSRVNLEPSLAIGERLGGHLVSGHVDCVGTVLEREDDGVSVRLRVGVPREYLRYIVRKGSVCVDGVSLTINAVSAESFTVNIIPHTAEVTIAGDYAVGSNVNIEVDLIARYLEGLLGASRDDPATATQAKGITRDFLKAHGYA